MSKRKELIGQGTYGCVFKPEFPCYKNTNTFRSDIARKSLIGKVFKSKESGDKEVEIMKTINKIDSKGAFTMPMLKSCEILLDINKLDDKNKCRHINYDIKEIREMHQLTYEHGHTNLYDFIMNNYNKYDIFNYINAVINIIKGICKLNDNKMCHRDMKETNLLMKRKNLYMIDFGLAINHSQVYTSENCYVLKHRYVYYPPEFKIGYKYIEYEHLNIDDDYIMENYKADLDLFKIVNYQKKDMLKDIITWKESIDSKQSKKEDQSKLAQFNIITDKIDIFSFGVVLLSMYEGSISYDKFTGYELDGLKYRLLNLIRKMVDFNPQKRVDCKDCLKELEKIKEEFNKLKKKKSLKKSCSSTKRHYDTMDSPSP